MVALSKSTVAGVSTVRTNHAGASESTAKVDVDSETKKGSVEAQFHCLFLILSATEKLSTHLRTVSSTTEKRTSRAPRMEYMSG
ncbi:hypothetical protein TYRP_021004 [Tyrophagus putrescentiae]|nr:hypothetical protein TYRP_021004 [Tyrophagus putrescentiae]